MTEDLKFIGPWRVLTQRPIYSNAWIDVTHHEVLTPRGEPGIYGTVRFKHLAVAVLPLTDDGFTWLVGQHRFPLDRYFWEIPEGGARPGEDPLLAGQRELREETGLVATRWDRVLEMHLSNSVTDEASVSYVARGLTQGEAEPEGTEELALKKVPFAEVCAMVARGEITDALSVATVLRVQVMLLEGEL